MLHLCAAQMYAGSKYPMSDIEKLKPGPALVHARALEPSMMDESTGSTEAGAGDRGERLRRVYPFTMTPDSALQKALKHIRYGNCM